MAAGIEGGALADSSEAFGSLDGPVLTMMSKRLRALKKKYNRIVQIEESKEQGKTINKEQEEVLKTKIAIAALIDEYEKLRSPLVAAVKEELAEREKESVSATLQTREEEVSVVDEKESESIDARSKENGSGSPEEVRKDMEGQSPAVSSDFDGKKPTIQLQKCDGGDNIAFNDPDGPIADLLKLLYFAQLFDVRSQRDAPSLVWTKVHERSSCLSYDFVTEDSTSPLLEDDLDALSLFGSLVTSRPPNATLSHKDALEQCIQHASLFLQNSDSLILSDLGITYSHLKERLNRILSSEYFTMTPELQTVSQQTAAAAAAGQYMSQVLMQETSAGNGVADGISTYYVHQDQAGIAQPYFQTGEDYAPSAPLAASGSMDLSNANVTVNADPVYVSDSNAADVEISQVGSREDGDEITAGTDVEPEPEQVQQEQMNPATQAQEQPQQQSHVSVGPRGYQGPRGGGRGMGGRGRGYANGRAYANGRGGRGVGYANGRGGQYYDQGGYYPRNHYGRGGGRGARGGGGGIMNNGHVNGPAPVTASVQTV